MQAFQAYLWKEWRDQRAVLGALAVALLVATMAIGSQLDWNRIDPTFTYEWTAALCAGAALLTVGSDLFTRERQRGRLQFLERLPRGLSAAFHGKLSFFVLVLCAAVLYGALLAILSGLVFSGEIPAFRYQPSHRHFAALFATAALWVFAVSTWVPTSVLTVPTSAILAMVYLLPAWFLLRAAGFPPPRVLRAGAWTAALAFGMLLCARLCFVHAAARSRPRRTAVWCGLALGAFVFLPCTVQTGKLYAKWLNRPYLIRDVLVGQNAQFAFFSLRPEPWGAGEKQREAALVLDLESLERVFAGTNGSSRFQEMNQSGRLRNPAQAMRLALHDRSTGRIGPLYDPATGKPIVGDGTPVVTKPYEPADFGLERFPGIPHFGWSGLGQRVFFFGPDRSVSLACLRAPSRASPLQFDPSLAMQDVRALSNGILIGQDGAWSWLNPDSGELTDFEHLREDEELGVTLSNGDLLVYSQGGIEILDPHTGSRAPVEIRGGDGWSGAVRRLRSGHRFDSRAPLDADRATVVLVEFESKPGWRMLALLDVPNRELRRPPGEWTLKGAPQICWSEGSRAIFIEGYRERLVHYDFETDERRVLLDVSELTH